MNRAFGSALFLAVLIVGTGATTGAGLDSDTGRGAAPGAASAVGRGEYCSLFVPADGATNDRFGSSIGLDGNTMAIGAWLADVGELRDAGAATLYQLGADGSEWTEAQRLIAAAPEAGAGFGFAVDLDGDILAISAQNKTVDQIAAAGAVHIFEPAGSAEQRGQNGQAGSWVEVATLRAPTPASGDLFGNNIEVDAGTGTVVVGAPGADPVGADGVAVEDGGAAHVFVREADGSWAHQAALVDPRGQSGDRMGNDVAVSGDWIAVGHHLDDAEAGRVANAGGALVFRRTESAWDGPTEILGSDSRRRDRAGIGVDIDGQHLAMTGWAQESNDRAVAWVFRYDGEGWVEQARIEPGRSTTPGSHFGRHLELSDGLLAIGASLDDAVHFYEHSNGFWLERAKLGPARAVTDVLAGVSLALSEEWVALGAERATLGPANSGGACVVRRGDVLDGSLAPDQRLNATAAVVAIVGDGGTGSSSIGVLVVAGVATAVLLLGVMFALVVRRSRRRSELLGGSS